MSTLENFSTWKQFLSNRIEEAKDLGMSEESITSAAQQIGNYLSSHVKPENKEEQILKELWNVASSEEQKALARTMIKLVQTN